jgi:taurine dioxygenase
MTTLACEFVPTDAPVGLEVRGVDLSQDLADDDFARIEKAFDDNGLLIFRGQRLTEEQHIRFSRRFGELVVPVLTQYLHPKYRDIFIVSNVVEDGRSIGSNDAGQFWHTDMSYSPRPARGSLLYAREVPMENGKARGDTQFSSMYAAYEALPEPMKRRLEGLTAIHGYGERYNKRLEVIRTREGSHEELSKEQRVAPQAEHPVVRSHPRTGRKCLYVNEGLTERIVGLAEAESRSLLHELWAHCTRPEFVYTHAWRVGDLLMWDNCSTQHNAVADYRLPLRRLMHRTTIKGPQLYSESRPAI